MTTVNDQIVPIFYVGGCAGTLVASLLTSAKRRVPIDHDSIDYQGTMHSYIFDFMPKDPYSSIDEIAADQLQQNLDLTWGKETEWPLYVPHHPITGFKNCQSFFAKSLTIIYDLADINQLSWIRMTKIPYVRIENQTNIQQKKFLLTIYDGIRYLEPTDQHCILPWKTIISGDLLRSLSRFSGYNIKYFDMNRQILDKWRSQTLKQAEETRVKNYIR